MDNASAPSLPGSSELSRAKLEDAGFRQTKPTFVIRPGDIVNRSIDQQGVVVVVDTRHASSILKNPPEVVNQLDI
jgi:hypothetical protein